MRAAGLARQGDRAGLLDAPEPSLLGRDDVLVRSALTPVNPADAWLLAGGLSTAAQRYPLWAGVEVVGTVEAIGPAVDDLQIGDLVLAGTSFLPEGRGTHAERLVIGHRYRVPLSRGSDPGRYAGLPVAVGAAILALDLARLHSDDLLAVTGAAGAVGRAVVQLAVRSGVRVIGIGRLADQDDINALGCESFIDGARLPSDLTRQVDAVIDAAALGGVTTRLVRPGGTVVALRPFAAADAAVRVVPTSVAALLAAPTILARAVAAVDHGRLAPPVLEPFAATDVDGALNRLDEQGRRGARPALVW